MPNPQNVKILLCSKSWILIYTNNAITLRILKEGTYLGLARWALDAITVEESGERNGYPFLSSTHAIRVEERPRVISTNKEEKTMMKKKWKRRDHKPTKADSHQKLEETSDEFSPWT